MVDESINKLKLNVRAWGCKIKSKISVEANLSSIEVKQGNAPEVLLHFEFDASDLPNALEVTLDLTKPMQYFQLKDPVRVEVQTHELDLKIPLEYVSAETGVYRLEINFRHAEYGTELVQVQPIIFKVVAPDVEILYCRTEAQKLSKGQVFDIRVGLNFPAPQKLRGILYGRLISDDDLVNRLYELEPKRTSILGEKEFVWHQKVPQNETKTGKLKAIIEFKSKDGTSKKEFENFIEIRQTKNFRVNNIEIGHKKISINDEQIIQVELENIGLESINLELYIEFINKDMIGWAKDEIVEKQSKDLNYKWTTVNEVVKLSPDEAVIAKFSTTVPGQITNGSYLLKLYSKYLDTGVADKATEIFSIDGFEIKEHHDVQISNAVVSSDKFHPGEDADIKILIIDNGTRTDEEVEIDCKILDIFNQDIFKKSFQVSIGSEKKEYNLPWPVPSGLEGGKYDLVVTVNVAGSELTKRRFSKLIEIELPVRLELHIMLPSMSMSVGESAIDPGLKKYLIENEVILEKKEFKDLGIYFLNSNSHLYTIDDRLIIETLEKRSDSKDLSQFIEKLLSRLIVEELLNPSLLKLELEYWNRVGYCWVNLVLMDKNLIKGAGIKDVTVTGKGKLNPSTWRPIAHAIFKNAIPADSKGAVKLDKIFKDDVIKDKTLINTKNYQILNTILRFAINPDLKNISNKKIIATSTPRIVKENLVTIIKLTKIIQYSFKYKRSKNSELLSRKFNKILNKWFSVIRKGKSTIRMDEKLIGKLSSFYYYMMLYLATKIAKILRAFKHDKDISFSDLRDFLWFKIIYYYIYLHFIQARIYYDPHIRKTDLSEMNYEFNQASNELKGYLTGFWDLHNRWQQDYINYIKNMKKRASIAYIYDHVKITTNPIIFNGIRGSLVKNKLIFGNNGSKSVTLDTHLGLPSTHWSLTEPEAIVKNNLYYLGPLKIPPKQTREVPITISFPNSLSFTKYKAILKVNHTPFMLLPEIN